MVRLADECRFNHGEDRITKVHEAEWELTAPVSKTLMKRRKDMVSFEACRIVRKAPKKAMWANFALYAGSIDSNVMSMALPGRRRRKVRIGFP